MSATMDVQTSTALISSDSVAVECFFLTGSQSKGCHVEIYFTDNSTISRNISRFSDYSFVGMISGLATTRFLKISLCMTGKRMAV